jgi:septum formation protein
VIDVPVPVVLASRSPTRRRLLETLLCHFDVVAPEVNEATISSPKPADLAAQRAAAKARDVAARRPDALVIGADTLAVCGGEVIGKPRDRADATRILRMLTQSVHEVITAVCVVAPDGREVRGCAVTRVEMRVRDDAEIERLADRPGVLEKAGAYELQADDPHVVSLDGSASTVMGLPLENLRRALLALYPTR